MMHKNDNLEAPHAGKAVENIHHKCLIYGQVMQESWKVTDGLCGKWLKIKLKKKLLVVFQRTTACIPLK